MDIVLAIQEIGIIILSDEAIKRSLYNKRLSSMTREQLIAEPDCDGNCPEHVSDRACGCQFCHRQNGYLAADEDYGSAEILARPQGALGPDGCELPRDQRSKSCLGPWCNPFSKIGVFTHA